MDETIYQKWLNNEEEWIGKYCRQIRKNSIIKVVPLVLVITSIVTGGISFLDSSNIEDLFIGIVGGVFFGLIICTFYLLILFMGSQPKRYVKKIKQSIEELCMSDEEKEVLGKEMLDVLNNKNQVLSYQVDGPKSKSTPARIVRTPHYFFQVGSTPYSVLIRLSDIAEIKIREEKKVSSTRSGNMKTHYYFKLYTIGFYRKDRFENGLSDSKLPDYAMGFFQQSIRDKAFTMLQGNTLE